jgi:outer membrane receptor protein involved in Fe transport
LVLNIVKKSSISSLAMLRHMRWDHWPSQGFSSSSNGFGGFPANTSASQDSTAFYVDLEADITDAITMQAAVRNEDFSTFGETTDYKIAGVVRLTDQFRLRGAISTGFHAPTAGQASITNVTTQIVNGALTDQGTLPLFSAPWSVGCRLHRKPRQWSTYIGPRRG